MRNKNTFMSRKKQYGDRPTKTNLKPRRHWMTEAWYEKKRLKEISGMRLNLGGRI